ncbi:Protein-lysine N-methyltransferase efm4 [Dimargaris xerosporica]|nr:Protein-lysine N-methyltransferase efm4 [Dimargaris xerosporica]
MAAWSRPIVSLPRALCRYPARPTPRSLPVLVRFKSKASSLPGLSARLQQIAVATLAPHTMVANDKAHHNPKGGFINPWPSHQTVGLGTVLRAMVTDFRLKNMFLSPPKEALVAVNPLNSDQLRQPSGQGLQLTWLGHASFLLQANGLNILFDPVFSDRCSPFQFVGPKRIRPTPCVVQDLPPIDVVVISHNHYDHMDVGTIRTLGPKPQYIVPLGNKQWLQSLGVTHVREMDWWDEETLDLGAKEGDTARSVRIACTPCQHFTGRGILDRFKTLWASFCLLFPNGQRFYYAGDTGYRTVKGSEHEKTLDQPGDTTPVCPAFKTIGEQYGPFDLACIPIGAYSPRWVFSPVHCSPEDAVRVHEDVQSKKSVGMHWGTFILTDEPVDEPPSRLAAALAQRGHASDSFVTLAIGDTMAVPITAQK